MLQILLADIVPVFAIAGAGYVLARHVGTSVKTLSHVVFYVALPCLAFRMLVSSQQSPFEFGRIGLLVVLIATAMAVVGYLLATCARLNGVERRAFLLVVMFSNTGNYGLPVVQFAFGDAALAYGTIVFLIGSVLTYTVGGFVAAGARANARQAFMRVLRMPALYGVALAFVVLATGRPAPDVVMRPVTLLGDAALPMMILVLGMQLERTTRPAQPGVVALAVVASLIIAPIISFGLTALFGIHGPARQALITMASMPTAVATTILALEFDLAPDFVTSTVFVSTIVSPVTLTLLIAYLK